MKKIFVGTALFIAGALALGGANAFFSYTNQMEFCTSCHTMQWNFEEYKKTVHYKNASGVQAICSDCHVPHSFFPKLGAKIMAVEDIYHEIVGTVDTKEKFEKRKWKMANDVWDQLKASDSSTCRKCHDFRNMDLSGQSRMARKKHSAAEEKGETCIDCHHGIAHSEPDPPLDDIEL
jgi:cytochrome c-type protein NapC